ncbi:tachykinins isoform X2 [Pseudomyrmex gracilis]|uniref:tachykinins isoform X2 n=1 Tax=Pseudomyrmex gracilis TaxID=219809 RepID=UPI000994A793|nr:tachykinins isoform X2 [Pseudomyrmex gracilis]
MLICSLLLLAISITSSFAEESSANDAASAKRAPMGFQGMRGKKDLSASSERDELSKTDLLDVQPTQDKDDLNNLEDNLFLHDEFEKRVPMGFQGMRGKKDYFMPDFEDSYVREDYEKRAPMGFQGMRGKKSLEEILREIEKKAAISFHDTREKKPYAYSYPQGYEKRLFEMNFQGARSSKEELPADWEKRAPMGFQGMRGKKALLEELEKRAVMGFQGMRGKKDTFENYVDYYMEPSSLDKRALMSFQGMRGKKDYDKRAPMGFQGMRGKRNGGPRFATGMDFEPRLSNEFQDSQ